MSFSCRETKLKTLTTKPETETVKHIVNKQLLSTLRTTPKESIALL